MPRDREKQELSRGERFYPTRRQGGFDVMNPFNLIRRLSDEMDRVFGDFVSPEVGRSLSRTVGGNVPGGDWMPAIEVRQKDNNIIVRADLPGVNPEDVKVELQEDGLLIEGETKHEEVQEKEGFFHSERSYGRFSRFIPLPENVDADQISANYRNGVLELTIPVPEQVKNKKQIQIQTEGTTKGKGEDKKTTAKA
jgi:HSP20 family protein